MIPGMVPALDRAMRLLQLLAQTPGGALRVSELQQKLNASRASFFRLLRMLSANGWIIQDPDTGAYRFGAAVMRLGFVARDTYPLAEHARPLLREIASATHQMSELIVAVGGWRLLTLEVWTAERTPLRFRARAGMEFFLNHLSAHGLVFLSCGNSRLLSEYERLAHTAAGRAQLGLPAVVKLSDNCARWRKLGYAWLRQSQPVGNARLSVPVYDPHSRTPSVLAALGVACPSDDIDGIRAARWAPLLSVLARKLEHNLSSGHAPSLYSVG